MNKVILTGRLTAKPELNYTQSQMAVTKFTIAVDRFSKDKGADFIRVTAFGRQAETICRYMDKGRQIAIYGRIQTGSYKDEDGKTVYTTDVVVGNTEFLGSASEKPKQKAEEVAQDVSDFFGMDAQVNDGMPF